MPAWVIARDDGFDGYVPVMVCLTQDDVSRVFAELAKTCGSPYVMWTVPLHSETPADWYDVQPPPSALYGIEIAKVRPPPAPRRAIQGDPT